MAVHARPARPALSAVLVALLVLPLLAAAPATQPASDISDAAFDQALADAVAAGPGKPGFVAALQSVAPRFARVEPATEAGQATWTAVALNARGKGVDAIRFRVPDGEPSRDLLWAFAHAPGLTGWYIVRVTGEPGQGFRNFQKAKPAELFGGDAGAAPPDVTAGVIQTLEGEDLEPGREYLIWFTFKNEAPATLHVTLALLPTVGNPNARTAIKGLGLPKPVAPAGEGGATTRPTAGANAP